MSHLAGYWTYAVLTAFYLLGALVAWYINMLTVRQMQGLGIKKGMPYLWHFGMWNDVLTVHPFLASLVAQFGAEWVSSAWLPVATALGSVAGFGANWWWARNSTIFESHAAIDRMSAGDNVTIMHGQRMSVVGWIHVPHMSLIMAGIIMFAVWVFRGLVPWRLALGGTALLLAHALMGGHWPLRVFEPSWGPFTRNENDGKVAVAWAILMAIAEFFLLDYAVSA